jgi:hypothetical protein
MGLFIGHTQLYLKIPTPKIAFRLKLFRRFKSNELIYFIDFDRLCQNIFSKFCDEKFADHYAKEGPYCTLSFDIL